MSALLLTRATDWTAQQIHERLRLAAQALYVHGFISRADWLRIDRELDEQLLEARAPARKERP